MPRCGIESLAIQAVSQLPSEQERASWCHCIYAELFQRTLSISQTRYQHLPMGCRTWKYVSMDARTSVPLAATKHVLTRSRDILNLKRMYLLACVSGPRDRLCATHAAASLLVQPSGCHYTDTPAPYRAQLTDSLIYGSALSGQHHTQQHGRHYSECMHTLQQSTRREMRR